MRAGEVGPRLVAVQVRGVGLGPGPACCGAGHIPTRLRLPHRWAWPSLLRGRPPPDQTPPPSQVRWPDGPFTRGVAAAGRAGCAPEWARAPRRGRHGRGPWLPGTPQGLGHAAYGAHPTTAEHHPEPLLHRHPQGPGVPGSPLSVGPGAGGGVAPSWQSQQAVIPHSLKIQLLLL